MVSESPYRSAVSQTTLKAESALGEVSLLVAPRHTRLTIGTQVWTFADDHMTVIRPGRRKPKKKSQLLRGAHLYVARAWPTNEFGLWIERKKGVVQRLVGLRPIAGFSEESFSQSQALELLATRLQRALSPHAEGARAFELGLGQHRVLGLGYEDRTVLFARPLFRERPRRLVELRKDGSVLLARGKGDLTHALRDGVEVIASGDRIQFCHLDGQIAASIYLPWIGAEARIELTRRFQALVSPKASGRSRPARDSELSLNKQLKIVSSSQDYDWDWRRQGR